MIFLTKGDNNLVDDRGLYVPVSCGFTVVLTPQGQLYLTPKDVVGRARGCVNTFTYAHAHESRHDSARDRDMCT